MDKYIPLRPVVVNKHTPDEILEEFALAYEAEILNPDHPERDHQRLQDVANYFRSMKRNHGDQNL